MKRPSRTSAAILAIIVVLLLPLGTGVAAGAVPSIVHPYLWLAWPALVLLAVPVVVKEARRSRSQPDPGPEVQQESLSRHQVVAERGASVYQVGRDLVVLGESQSPPGLVPGSHPLAAPNAAESWTQYADVDHEQLFGVDSILARLGRLLANDNGDWIISIFGEGGAGKTTLAYEMVRRYATSVGFDRVAWVSAKFSHMRALGQLEHSRHTVISWHDLLLDVSRQLALDIELNPARIEDRLAGALRILDPTDRCLIVIDNLETLADAERAVTYLARSSVLRPHKVIITTREPTLRKIRTLMPLRGT
jgi:NB-ARC domain